MSDNRDDKLGLIFDLTLDLLLAKLKSGDIQPSELSTIRHLLRDNGIEARPKAGNALEGIIDLLPDFSTEEDL